MAIAGLGTDIVQISRIERSLARSPTLAERVLTADELLVFLAHAQPARFLAKRFAAKEAAAKALGTGIGRGVSWQQMHIDHDEFGAPLLVCTGYSQQLLEQRGVTRCWLTISDEQDYACATVVLESG
ncbi:holo-ACP synthase [Alkalimonas collagenimarina]|uniref:Holo-[acyl-carrier-protein] synthase n=1 Tax=Alkalimonas collagenimarina TaxID=400390 RepID=A0ABT9GXK9_9GAMM|nr:holo-ACP synthase [Alkalimonas collagenimarina]MDP4535420.1 holo-ACP synthase [Alkalimonas collagenimarina]